MKKVTLLCLADDRTRTLDALRELGVLHLEHIQAPTAPDLRELKRESDNIERTLNFLKSHLPKGASPKTEPAMTATAVMETGQTLLQEQRERRTALDRLMQEYDAQAPLGDFDPGLLTGLQQKGINLRIYAARAKQPDFSAADGVYFPLNASAAVTYFAFIGDGEPAVDATECPVPERRLRDVQNDISSVKQRLTAIENELAELSRETRALENALADNRSRTAYLEAEHGMGRSGKIEYLRGYCPVDRTEVLTSASRKQGWGLVIEDPADSDPVPTLIKSPAWIRPIRSLFKLLDIVPGYKEAETRSAFLIFFSLFFGILVNDAGYGLVFLILTIALRMKFKKAPAEPFKLFGLLSACSIIWGVLTGSYFGIVHPPAPLRVVEISWLKNETNFMAFAFLIGAIHLTVAHAWRALLVINSTRALAQLGWILVVWSAYFLARMLILGMVLPSWFLWICVTGMSLVILFMTPMRKLKTEWADHIMLPFDFIGSFADLVSYVRLFAVASASMAVAEAFNELALHKGIHSWQSGLIAVVILTIGHGLNIILALMSILVHGVRLNTLEFSSHVGLEWTGRQYQPFSKAIDVKEAD